MSYSSRSLLFSGFSFWVVLAFVGMYLVYPLDKNLKRGIDLVGGTYITLEVQTEKAVEDALVGLMQAVPQKLKDANVASPTSTTAAVVNQYRSKGNESVSILHRLQLGPLLSSQRPNRQLPPLDIDNRAANGPRKKWA